MYADQSILCIIPARGGSKGIPNKNIIDINGKPLIQYTIDAARSSRYIDDTIVSTDSLIIAEIARQQGAEIPFLRPASLATDTSKTIDSVIHAIEQLKEQGRQYDYVIILQPTQPLRTVDHIDKAIALIIENGGNSLLSVTKVKEHPILIRTISSDGLLQNLLQTSSTVRRQDFPDYYKVNGSIYINRIDEQLSSDTSLNDNEIPYEMEQKYDIDIDDEIDIDWLKFKLDLIANSEKVGLYND